MTFLGSYLQMLYRKKMTLRKDMFLYIDHVISLMTFQKEKLTQPQSQALKNLK